MAMDIKPMSKAEAFDCRASAVQEQLASLMDRERDRIAQLQDQILIASGGKRPEWSLMNETSVSRHDRYVQALEEAHSLISKLRELCAKDSTHG